jgi:hypothetical protein
MEETSGVDRAIKAALPADDRSHDDRQTRAAAASAPVQGVDPLRFRTLARRADQHLLAVQYPAAPRRISLAGIRLNSVTAITGHGNGDRSTGQLDTAQPSSTSPGIRS